VLPRIAEIADANGTPAATARDCTANLARCIFRFRLRVIGPAPPD
jgi:hypothetical protein